MQGEGYCECGCGERTNLARQTDTRAGWVKGEPLRFLLGHNGALQRAEAQYIEEPGPLPTPCHIWQGARDELGYARLGGRVAHRQLWERRRGRLSGRVDLDHLCRNPSCVNLDHLDPVTHAENCRRGIAAKLDAEKVRDIRARAAGGERHRVIAASHGVSRSAVKKVVARTTWADID